MEEVWKDIEGITGYLVSNMGRVKSIKSKKQVIRSLSDDKDGYKILWMPNGKGGDTSARVHRLVAKAFVPNPKNNPVIHHKNNIKYDNRPENLEWVTIAENTQYGYRDGVSRSAWRKYVAVYDGDKLLSVFDAYRKLAYHVGVSRAIITKCVGSDSLLLGQLILKELDRTKEVNFDLLNKEFMKSRWQGGTSKPVKVGQEFYRSIGDLSRIHCISREKIAKSIELGMINIDGFKKNISYCSQYSYIENK